MMVDSIKLFDIASMQANWLATRQEVIASNIANANTPNYLEKDIKPFSSFLQEGPAEMRVTNPHHMLPSDSQAEISSVKVRDGLEMTHSGNNVEIEDEMRKSGEVSRQMSLNTAIVKSFHRMYMAAVKG